MKRCNDIYQDLISIKKRIVKMKKVIGSYKDYDQNNILWSEVFFNYTIILMEPFGIVISSLHLALY